MYKTCARPVMTYAIETRAERSITERLKINENEDASLAALCGMKFATSARFNMS